MKLSQFHGQAEDLEEELAAAKAVRLELKAAGKWSEDDPEGLEAMARLAAASDAMNAFRSYWREIGAYQRAVTAADDAEADQ